jgi:hypothetical protein
MSSEFWKTFRALDELIQVIYQGFHRVILLSMVSNDEWKIHLALVGEGRWFGGSMNENDLDAFLVQVCLCLMAT